MWSESGPGSPQDWLEHAVSDLILAKIVPPESVKLESLCYHAQQAAEKALKALLLHYGIPFPRSHNIRILLDLIPDFLPTTEVIQEAAILTDYAVSSRYPGYNEPISREDLSTAVSLAEAIVHWVGEVLRAGL